MKRLGLIAGLIISTLLAGCAAAQTDPDPAEGALTIENPYAPQAGDDALIQSKAILENTSWDGVTQTLTITGNLPTPCNQLRVTIDQNGQRIDFNIYSVTEPDVLCAQMLQPFEASFKMESFNPQTFRVFINGQETQL